MFWFFVGFIIIISISEKIQSYNNHPNGKKNRIQKFLLILQARQDVPDCYLKFHRFCINLHVFNTVTRNLLQKKTLEDITIPLKIEEETASSVFPRTETSVSTGI